MNTSASQLISISLLDATNTYVCSISISISLLGIFGNIGNIIVFYKMGFSIPANISLFCLAIADLYCLVSTGLGSAAKLPAFKYADDLVMSVQDVSHTLASVYIGFSAMGSWITAVINVERSCCIVFPMKVKSIVTSRRVIYLIMGMAVYQIVGGLPRSFGIGLTVTTSSQTNRTLVIFDPAKYNVRLSLISLLASSSIPTLVCFIVVLVGTIFLITRFKHSRRLRDSMTTTAHAHGHGDRMEKITDKDAKLVRCVIVICCFYIFGVSPQVCLFIATTAEPSFNSFDPYLGNVVQALVSFGMLFQAISCSVNILVYFSLSSKFKQTLKQMFECSSERTKG